MYYIYVDDALLYSPTLSKDGYGVLKPKVTTELNKNGSLTFTLPPTNVMYNSINKLKSTLVVKQNNDEIFRGRVLNDEKDFYNRKQVYCEGELSFLVDSIVRPYSYYGSVQQLFTQYINNHNSQVDSDRQFRVGVVTVGSGNISESSNDYPKSHDEIFDKLVNSLGGYVRSRLSGGVRYIDYIKDYGDTSDQVIEFGRNLIDISEYINAENVFTVLIPLGATQKGSESNDGVSSRINISSVNGGRDYIEDADAVKLFGRIWKKNEWDDVTSPSALLQKGKEYLKSGIEMAVSLSVKAVDLSLMDVNCSSIKIGQNVRVLSKPHGLDKYFLCSKVILDLEDPGNSEYTFGVSFTSLTSKQVDSNKQAKSSFVVAQSAAQSANVAANKANEAANNADNVISQIPSNYVSTESFNRYMEEKVLNNLLPSVTPDDDGKTVKVSEGKWVLV